MAHFGDVRREAFGRVQSAQYYASNLAGLTAVERHKKLVNDYLTYYARPGDAATASAQPASIRTDADALMQHHRFIRSDADDTDGSWEARLAKRYYDRLFKEYAIVDLTYYKQSKLGMRWRTQKEVMAGKGQFVCGARGCDATDGLCSYEVNFAYQEAGERKQALVKLRVCPACAFKLNYRKEKQLRKASEAAAARKRRREEEEEVAALPRDPLVRQALDYVSRYAQGGGVGAVREDERGASASGGLGDAEVQRAAGDVAPPPLAVGSTAAAAAAAGGVTGAGAGGTGKQAEGAAGAAANMVTLPADASVWESKPVQEAASAEEEMDAYLEGL
ncbi:hypothetical protein Agub_g12589, partial [Astrephomene gubernaculifera]